jgi:hypothetical protein
MPVVEVFSRRGCHLCEVLIEELIPLAGTRAQIRVRDVDDKPEWVAEYGNDVPIVKVDGAEICRHRLDREALLAVLSGAR